ncbi:NAD(P)-binding protein [Panus rudis PR-1116 ss-1]|nr:NAD(P)-binding protein [Panus rudis PR-1116 ss-1]
MSQQPIPTTMKALIQGKGTATVQEIPIPQINDDEILVKNVTVALNPTDVAHIESFGKPGTICGVNFAGTIVRVGRNVTSIVIGNNVEGFVRGSYYTDEGAFAEYVKTSGHRFWTAVQTLFHPGHLGLVEPPEKISHEEWIFIYGGSSSVGMFAVELAHLAGYKVVSVASPRNFDLVKSYGADAVFNYRDPEAISKIKAVTGDSIHKAVDAISFDETSQIFSVKMFAPGPGKLITMRAPTQAARDVRSDIDLQGRPFDFFSTHIPAAPEDRAHMVQFLKKVPGFVKDGKIKPNPVKLRPVNGLGAILDGI